MAHARVRVLFSGYAPVHFLSFLPVYRELQNDPGVELWLSGGFRHKDADGTIRFESEGFYDPFDVDTSRVLPIEEARQQDFDVLVCAHLSDSLFPRSVKRTVQIFHGVSFKNYAVREKALRFDLLCLAGQYHASRYREQGLIRNGSQVLMTGFAKMDQLVSGELRRDELLSRLGLDASKPTLLYAPTGDRNNSLEIMGELVIQSLLGNDGWNLLVKPHDHPKLKVDWFEKLAPYEGATMKLVRDFDVIPYLHAANMLISDASSVITEFTLLDRPIVLLNVPKLFRRVIKRGGALDLETYGHNLGPVVDDATDLPDVVRAQLEDASRFAPVRRRMAEHVFHAPGSATRRVADVVRFAAGLLPELPADIEVLQPDETDRVDSTVPSS